jgi:hypothetical protein
MIEPGTMGDWMLLAGALASVTAMAVGGYRWVLRTDEAPAEPARTARTADPRLARGPWSQEFTPRIEFPDPRVGTASEERGDAA